MRTAILLGAGSSVPAGFPSTQCLTDFVVSGNGFGRHTDGTYGPAISAPPIRSPLFARCMSRRLHAEAKRYFAVRNGRPANYEDVFHLAKQALDELAGEAENPAIRAFVNQLKADAIPLIEDTSEQNSEQITFKELLEETINYITDIVWCTLDRKPESTKHLEIFVNACKSGHVVGISTLCHDTHLEAFLAGRGVRLADGFSDEELGVRYWNGVFPSGRILFLKLHGSVDWFRLRPDGPAHSPAEWSNLVDELSGFLPDDAVRQPPYDEPFFEERIGILRNGEPHHTSAAGGDGQYAVAGRPKLLIGTFNKISEYTRGMFRDLHYRFPSMLQEVDQLMVCGYAFGDKGINSEVINWYYAKRDRHLIVVHPHPDKLVSNARGAIRHKWGDWKSRGSLTLITKRLEDVGRDEIMEHLCA